MSKPWKCSQCRARLGVVFGERIHVQRQEVEAILRASGEITLICPSCGTLNEVFFRREQAHG